jgi:hypothetical protein
MIKRRRHRVVTVLTVLLAYALTEVAHAGGWSDAELYGAAAALIVLVGAVGLPWLEYAPDGAFQRRPRS